MYKSKFNLNIFIINIILVIILFSNYIFINKIYVNANEYINEHSKLKVEIAINMVNLYGYTSPYAKVELVKPDLIGLKNIQSTIETFADSNGYFYFSNIPFTSNNDLCLTSFDRNERSTKPSCLNSKNIQIYNQYLGPLIIPPTLSLTSDKSKSMTNIQAKGESVPYSTIYFNIVKKPTLIDKINDLISINNEAKASINFSLNSDSVKVDKEGYYLFNLPSSTRNDFIIKAQNIYRNYISSYSNDLHFKFNSNKNSILIKIIISLALSSLLGSLFCYRKKLKHDIICFYNWLELKLTRTF